MANESKMDDLIRTALSNLRSTMDTDTAIGNPILTASGTTIIPLFRVSVGLATGGVDFNGKKKQPGDAQNFGGGGGTGVSMTPIAILSVDKEGHTELINVGMKNPTDPIEQVADMLDKTPDLLARIKSVFKKDTAAHDKEKAEEAAKYAAAAANEAQAKATEPEQAKTE